MIQKNKDIFFHGQPPSPTSSALRGYGYKQLLCACGVAGLIKNISLFFCFATIFFSLSTLSYASIAGEVNKANSLYKQGKFDDSLDLYQKALDKDDKSSLIKYDMGTAFYKKGDYAKALTYLEQAAQDKNIKIKPKAEYNLGNVLYKSGIQKENSNVDEAIKSLQKALGYYGQSIAVDPRDQDAVYNQDFVKKEIERLKQKKQQQQQQNKKNQQQKKDQQKQDQKQQQDQQNKQDQKNQQSQHDQQKQQQKQQDQQQQQNQQQQNQQQQNTQAQAQQSQKELDRKQAEDLLEDYQENEEPKKLLNYMPKKIDDRPVLKDW